jgi:hypothetical protein
MKQRISSLPMLVVVAVVALVLGSVGTAVAGPAVTKAKVKSIATKIVNKKAPTLSVANATNAANAANATNLNGQPATTYLDRVAFTSATTGVAVPAGFANQILGPVNITIPAGVNFVRVDGAATMTGGNFGLYWAADAACSQAGPEFASGQYTVATTQGNASFHIVLPVAAGVHSYRLCSNNAAATLLARSLLVETIATGATGGTTITKPADSANVKPGAPGQAPR